MYPNPEHISVYAVTEAVLLGNNTINIPTIQDTHAATPTPSRNLGIRYISTFYILIVIHTALYRVCH
jgi:hypothetical protein